MNVMNSINSYISKNCLKFIYFVSSLRIPYAGFSASIQSFIYVCHAVGVAYLIRLDFSSFYFIAIKNQKISTLYQNNAIENLRRWY